MKILWIASFLSLYIIGALSGNVPSGGMKGKPDLIEKVRTDHSLPPLKMTEKKLHVHGG